MPTRLARLAPACLPLALVLAACGGGASATGSAPAASPSAATSPEASAAPPVEASPSASAGDSGSPAAGITVTAVDYKFEGVPDTVKSGTTLSMTNTGTEVHEMVVVRKLPTTTKSFQELLALPGDEAQQFVENIGVAYAEPGQTAEQTVTTGEPGDYIMLCFIPQGTTSIPSIDPNSSEPPQMGTGAPHFTLGMQQEFTVTD